jgi:uncharacterized integral membrane protein
MKYVKIILALVILIVMFIFGVNNAQSVQVIFFSYHSPPLPLFLILLFSFSLGFVMAALVCAIRFGQLRRQIALLRRELKTKENGASEKTV